jgi:putative transposase
MPRTARAAVGGYCYHALNRGNRRAEVFRSDDDYHAFVRLLRQASSRVPMRLLGYCLMPNHFHLVLWPAGDDDLSAWMGWLLTTHVRRYQKHYQSTGHVWQGRFKAFPIEEDQHLLTVLRYVERNPLRANLVAQAEDWPWSSLRWWVSPPFLPFVECGPVPRGPDWVGHVNAPQTEAELARLRESVRRERPFGDEAWTRQTAAALGLESSLRPRGRPLQGQGKTRRQDTGPSLFS